MSSNEASVLYQDEVLRLVRAPGLAIAAWTNAPTMKQFREIDRLARDPSSVDGAYANVIWGGTPRFTDEVRTEAIRLIKLDAFRAGNATVILADGLVGAATRAFISMIILVSRSSKPNRVFGDVSSAAEFLAKVLKQPQRRAEIARLIGERPTGPGAH
jgi:hypothetical protein